jgi:hypothetical protein
MRRMVLVALLVFCGLLLASEKKASAIPCTFTWDVSGSMTGSNLGTYDSGSWYAEFVIESTDLSWSDSWGSNGTIANTSGNVVDNISFFNSVTYDLDGGKTYNVDWRIYANANVGEGRGSFEWEIDGQMGETGSFVWVSRDASVCGQVSDNLGSDSYSQSDPTSVSGSASYGIMTAESSAAMDVLNVQGDVSNSSPNIYMGQGYSEALFSGTLEVLPDVLPAPGGLMLGALGIAIVGWLRGRRTL